MRKKSNPDEYATFWDAAASYPSHHNELNDWQWRWEFLRRSDEYRQAWKRSQRIPDEPEVADFWRMPHKEDRETAELIFHMTLLLDPGTPSTSPVPGPVGIFTVNPGGYLFRGMRSDEPEKALERFRKRRAVSSEAQIQFLISMLRNQLRLSDLAHQGRLALAAFDLSKPVKPQLQRVEKMVSAFQKARRGKVTSPKLQRRLWPIYLRCLDAVEDGARPMEIFRQFESEGPLRHSITTNEAAKIEGWIKAAKEVQEKIIYFL